MIPSTAQPSPPEPNPVGVASTIISNVNQEQLQQRPVRDPEEPVDRNLDQTVDQTVGNLVVPNDPIERIQLSQLNQLSNKTMLSKAQGSIQYQYDDYNIALL